MSPCCSCGVITCDMCPLRSSGARSRVGDIQRQSDTTEPPPHHSAELIWEFTVFCELWTVSPALQKHAPSCPLLRSTLTTLPWHTQPQRTPQRPEDNTEDTTEDQRTPQRTQRTRGHHRELRGHPQKTQRRVSPAGQDSWRDLLTKTNSSRTCL